MKVINQIRRSSPTTFLVIDLIWTTICIVGATYLIGWCGWSKWTMVLAIIFCLDNVTE